MPSKLQVLAPDPIDHEQRPLLNQEQPTHGTVPRVEQPVFDHDTASVPPESSIARTTLNLLPANVGCFFAAIDITLIATLAIPITDTFGSASSIFWVITAYMIAASAVQPLVGRISDIFGRRAGLNFACITFFTGNLICGLAPSLPILIAGRAISGIGGGSYLTVGACMMGDLVPLRQRALWVGYGNIFYGLGSALGGALGGFISDRFGWRWTFLCQLPFLLVSGIIATFTVDIPVKDSDKAKLKRIDYLGAVTIVSAVVSLLIGLDSGGNRVPWGHPLVLTSLPLAALLFAAFILVELHFAVEPIIPVKLLWNRTAAISCIVIFLNAAFVFTVFYTFAAWLRVVQGQSGSQIGLRLVASAVGIACGSLSLGFTVHLTGKYYWLLMLVQAGKIATGLIVAFALTRYSDAWLSYAIMFSCGFFGAGGQTLSLPALLSSTSQDHQAVMSSASYLFRSVGTTVGVTTGGVIFQNAFRNRLWERFGDYPHAAETIAHIRQNLGVIDNLGPKWRDGVIAAYVDSTRFVWYALVASSALALAVGLFIREMKLQTTLDTK